jgi:translocation and assembly module TamB
MSLTRALRRLLFWLFALPLLLVALMLAVAGLAISTETGLRGLLALAERLAPGQLSYEHVSGRLLGPLRIEGLRYEDGPLQVALENGDFDWQPTDLFSGRVHITRLHVEGLDLRLPPGDDPEEPAEPLVLSDLELPLAVHIADLQARALHLQFTDAEPIQIDAINLKARFDTDGLALELLDAGSPLGEVQFSGQLTPSGDYPLHIQMNWRAVTPEHGAFQGHGELSGALLDELRLTQNITGAATLELSGQVRQPLAPEPAWSVEARLDVPDLEPLVPDLAGRPLTARIDARGVLTRFQGQGEIATDLPELGPATLAFTAAGDEHAIQVEELRLTAADRPLTLTARGEVQFAELRFAATGQWQVLTWPLTGPSQIESTQGEFAVEGGVEDYQFQLAADLQGPDIPRGRWTLTGRGSDQAVRDVRLSGQTLEGTLEGEINASWLPAVTWRVALNGRGLNPGAQWPEVPGTLDLRLRSDGSLENDTLTTQVWLDELAGTLSGQAVRGNAEVAIQNQDLNVKTLRLSAGDARLEAEGTLAQIWDLRWTLDAPQLQSLVPGLSGTVASTGSLSGSRAQPTVAANFTVRNLRHGDTRIQQLNGEARVDVAGASRSQLNVTGAGLVLGGQNWRTVSLAGSGLPEAHELTAELAGEPGQFGLALNGNLQLPALLWQGRITQLSARGTVAGDWSLEQAVAVRASAEQARLESACLRSAPTRVCLQGQWDAARGFNGDLRLDELAPQRFQAFLPPGLDLATRVSGTVAVSGDPAGALQGRFDLRAAPGSLRLEAEGQPLRFTLNGASLQGNFDDRALVAEARLDLAQTGQLQTNLRVQDPLGDAQVEGRLNAAITDLSVVALFVPQLHEVTGQLRADLTASGALPRLVLRGQIRLENAGAAIPEAGINLQDLQVTAASNGQGPLQISGSVRSGPGQLQLTGTVDPLKPELDLNIQGRDFQVLDTSDLQMRISPDLQIAVDSSRVRVDGEVVVPSAFLRPPEASRPGAIRPSGDVIIVSRDDQESPQPGIALFARVRVVLGDDVRLETPVFKARLAGSLLVEETPELAPRGSGRIEVVAGNYRIFGEEIEVQRGQLLFSNSPLDNPGLDLRVARQSTDRMAGTEITAGAQIRGTLRQPQLTLFSDPRMSDPDILSLLVLGRTSGGTGGEAALLFRAANALGLGGGGVLGEGLGGAIGLDTLELDTSNGDESAALMLGKFLTPNLYVGYGVGLMDAVNVFNVRYRISRRLMFESTSSVIGSGADLIYTIER